MQPVGTRVLLFLLALLILLTSPLSADAQDPPVAATAAVAEPDTFGWRNSLVAGVTLSQSAFSNWAGGGTSSAAFATSLRGTFLELEQRFSWRHQGNLELGALKQQGEKLRKSADAIEGETLYIRMLDFFVDPYASASLKTQFAKGRDYDAEPDTSASGDLIFPASSDFADPLYLAQSLGVGRTVIPNELTTRAGFTIRETLTDIYRGYAINDDEEDLSLGFNDCTGNPACDKNKFETGLESITEYTKKLAEETGLTTKLGFFYSFEQPDELDVNWRSDLTIKALKFLSINVGLELLFDEDVVDKLQTKQLLGIGVSYNLL